MLESVRAAQASAGVAMARLAYQVVGLRPQALGNDKCVHVSSQISPDTGRAWTLSDLSLLLFNPKRDSPEADEAAEFEPDGPTLANYRSGLKMPDLVRINLAMSRLIQEGLLQEDAFQLVQSDSGTHRALEPFRSLLLQLACARDLTPLELSTLQQQLEWLRAGQQDLDRILAEDRTNFRRRQLELLDELLALRAHIAGKQRQARSDLAKNLRWILRRAECFVIAMHEMRIATVVVAPESYEPQPVDDLFDSAFDEANWLILGWAREVASADPEDLSAVLVEQLIRLVDGMRVDVWTSMNLDVAEPVPLAGQPWRSPALQHGQDPWW